MAVAKWVDPTFHEEAVPELLVAFRSFGDAMVNAQGGPHDSTFDFKMFVFDNISPKIDIDGQKQECNPINWSNDGRVVVFTFCDSSEDYDIDVDPDSFAFVYYMDGLSEQQVELHLLRTGTHEYLLQNGEHAASLLPS